jgi:hypothetical protein
MSHWAAWGSGAVAGYAREDDKQCTAELELEREIFVHNRVEGSHCSPSIPLLTTTTSLYLLCPPPHCLNLCIHSSQGICEFALSVCDVSIPIVLAESSRLRLPLVTRTICCCVDYPVAIGDPCGLRLLPRYRRPHRRAVRCFPMCSSGLRMQHGLTSNVNATWVHPLIIRSQ